jgi:tetratricopeptide (TPR) repeat protein
MACPDPTELARFALRTLAPTEVAAIEAHIDACGSCRAASSALVTASRGEVEASEPVDRPRAAPGDQIDRFVILHELGEGAASVVYAAYDPQLDRNVALKLLRPRSGISDRVLREGRALARLSHPNIVSVFEVGEAGGQLYIALELVEGVTVRQWVALEKRGWREVRDVFVAAARGLAALHRAGLVHRDIKPDNIVVGPDRVRLVDFGLVGAGAGAGTPAYMAPEARTGDADARSDQYSLCATLAASVGGLAAIDDPARLDVPRRLRRAIARGLAQAPEDRFSSDEALIAAMSDRPTWQIAVPASIAIGGLAVATAIGLTGSSGSPCDDTPPAWTMNDRAAVEHALAASTAPFAAAARARVLPRLDAFADGWRRERTAVCRAYRDKAELSAERFDRRVGCLDRARAAFAATQARLALGDPGTLEHAIDLAAGLPALAACRDDEALARAEQLPASPKVRASIAAIDDELAAVEVARRAGDPGKALERARHALEAAKQAAFGPSLARAAYAVADLLERAGDTAGATPLADQAVQAAASARLDGVEAKGWILQLYLLGVDGEAKDSELAAARRAGEAAAARARDRLIDAHLDNVLGLIAKVHGDYAGARTHYEAALATLKAATPDGPEIAATLANLSTVEARLGDLDAARAAATEAAQRDRETFGEKHPVYADSLVTLAARETDAGDGPHAIDHLEQALAIDQAAYGDRAAPVMIVEQNLANTLGEFGKLDAARPHAERALALAEQLRGPQHPETAKALLTIANLAAEQRDFARANETAQRALAIVEASFGPGHPMAAAIQANLGEWALRAGDAATAETRLRAALAGAATMPDSPDVAMMRTVLGDALFAQGKRSEAIEQLEAALALRQKIGDEPVAIADSQFSLGRALWPSARAKKLVHEAVAVFDKSGEEAAPYREAVATWAAKHHVTP